MFQKLKNMPIGAVATSLGAATVSQVYYLTGGFSWLRHFFMCFAGFMASLAMLRVLLFFPQVKEEYKNPILASLYATITMCLMLFASYLQPYFPLFSMLLFFFAVSIHMMLIVIFIFYHFIRNFNMDKFLPSAYVTPLGLLVSTVVGYSFFPDFLVRIIFIYGIIMYFFMLMLLIYRLATRPVPVSLIHTKTILLAPCSLCVLTYLNFISIDNLKNIVNSEFVLILYGFVFLSLVYILTHLFDFFSTAFTPGFAGLTFPMAIGTLASRNVALYFMNIESSQILGNIIMNIMGIQMFISTAFIGIVLFNFKKIFLDSLKS